MTQPETVQTLLAELGDASPTTSSPTPPAAIAGRVAFASSLGREDQVLTHMIAEAGLDIPIFTLDTGRLYPRDLRPARPDGQTLRPVHQDVLPGRRRGREDGRQRRRQPLPRQHRGAHRCCEVRKILPLRRAQLELDAWICGLRSGQGATRQKVEIVEWDQLADMVKINPLAAWDESARVGLHPRHDVPYNPLHDQGFPSIGCAPCTRAVAEGEDGARVAGGGRRPSTASVGCTRRAARSPARPPPTADRGRLTRDPT